MKKLLLTTSVLLALTGCATQDYAVYANTQQTMAKSKSDAEIARYQALAEIAKQGDTTAKVAAVMSLQFGNNAPGQAAQINAPVSAGDQALRWASVILPSLTQIYGITRNADVAINQSNNSAAVSMNTNGTMMGISQSGVAAVASTAQSGFTNMGTLGQAGIAGVTTTAQSGITGMGTLGQAGIAGMGTLGQAGIAGVTTTAQSGITGMGTLGQAGITNMGTLGQASITNMGTLGQAGIAGAVAAFPFANPPAPAVVLP